MPKRLDRDQGPKKEGRKGRVTCWARQRKKRDDEQDKNERQKERRVKMTVKTKKEKTDKCTEKWCGRRVEREVKAYEWLHYNRTEETLFHL